jgi:hypothetical protein
MAAMKKRMAVAVTVGVWMAALGSAAALTYNANRPENIAGGGSQVDAPSDTAGAAAVESIPESEPVVYMQDVTIVGKAHSPSALTRRPKPSVDIADMQCARLRTRRSPNLGLASLPPQWLAGRVLGEDASMPAGMCSPGPRECAADWRDIDIGFGHIQMCQ